jgi:tRNA(Ile)-lysidine synthase
MNKNFLKKLQNYIFQEKLLEQKDRVIIGISGGPDSIGLVLVLKKLQLKYLLKLQLIHINYNQRGADSNQDEKFVRDFAEKNDLDLKVIQYKKSFKVGNLEEQLRNFRYQKFEEIRQELEFDKIVVAHTQDDQAETFLMNLLRGSGLQGLTGMLVKNNFIIRPFLSFTKSEILEFLKENQQKFQVDKTNLKTDFTRNKIRLKLIPFLEENFNFDASESLGKLTTNLQSESQLNQFLVNKIYKDLIEKDKEKLVLDILKLKKMSVGVWNAIFRKVILELKGDLKNISYNNFLEFKKIIESKKSKKQKMQIGKIVLIKNNNHVIFSKV